MPMSREEANKRYLEIVHGYSGERGPINWPQKNSPPVPPLQPQSPFPKAPIFFPLVTTARIWSPVRNPCTRLGPLARPLGKPCASTFTICRFCLPVA